MPDTDLIAFMHRRESHVDIVQALVRAVRKAPGKRYGYVLIPLRLKRSSGESLIQAVARSDMSTVWRTLAALAEQDDAMLNEVQRAAVDQGETGQPTSPGWFNKLHVIAPAGRPDAGAWARQPQGCAINEAGRAHRWQPAALLRAPARVRD